MKSNEQKFLDRITFEPNTGCWIWTAGCRAKGYGYFYVNKKSVSAHRYSYLLYKGEIKNNLFVLHKCDTPPCVNPQHLFLGTNADNIRDMVAKKRQNHNKKTHCIHGHEFTKENTILKPSKFTTNMTRECRRCAYLNRNRRYLIEKENKRIIRERKKPKTHCPSGHEYNTKNTYYYKGDHKNYTICRPCKKLYIKKYRKNKKRKL